MKHIIAATALALALAAPASAQEGLVTKPSKYSVAESIDRIEAAVKKKAHKYQIFARIDFQALARGRGGQVRPSQLLIFGGGGVLDQLLPAHPVTAIDLPPRVLAWEDENGRVWLTYITGDLLKARHGIEDKDHIANLALETVTRFTASYAAKALK